MNVISNYLIIIKIKFFDNTVRQYFWRHQINAKILLGHLKLLGLNIED
jgi:hypothetical protein